MIAGTTGSVIAVGLLLYGAGSAQQALAPPRIGFVSDRAQSVRPLLGISGNFWLGDSIVRGVLAAASSGQAVMVKTPTELRVYAASGQLQGEAYRAEGAATFAFTQAGAPAFAWLPGSGVLLHWNGSQFDIVPVSAAIQGDVIALAAPGPATAALLVNRAGVLWRMDIATPGGAIAFEAPMPGVTAPALLLNDGTVIYAADGAPVVRAPSGQQRRTAIAGRVTGFSLLGPDWIRIDGDSPARTYALRLSSGALFVLPEVSR